MIYGIIAPGQVEREQRSAAKEKIVEMIDGLDEPEAIVTNGGEGLPAYAAHIAQKRWPNAVHQVVAPSVPRPAGSFDYKLKRVAQVQMAPAGSAGQSVRNAQFVLIGIVDKIIALIETENTYESVLAEQIDVARTEDVPVTVERLPR